MITHIFTGFDSAWTDNLRKPGALASIIQTADGKLSWVAPRPSTFDQAVEIIESLSKQAPFHLVAIDQPTVVPNLTGRRPVERVVGHLIGRLRGGVQPSHQGRTEMFGATAAIWKFLSRLPHLQLPFAAVRSDQGYFMIEVFPALAITGLFPWFAAIGHLPKYNPHRRKTFKLSDWWRITYRLGAYGERHKIEGLSTWSRAMLAKAKPHKFDQDAIDAALCAIQALEWWRHGLANSVVVGEAATGYMVASCCLSTRNSLREDAASEGVPFCVAW
jgi:predicted RNase H-like nuclease